MNLYWGLNAPSQAKPGGGSPIIAASRPRPDKRRFVLHNARFWATFVLLFGIAIEALRIAAANPGNECFSYDRPLGSVLCWRKSFAQASTPPAVSALGKSPDGYHVFTFEGIEPDFVIEADQLDEIDKRISERYRIPEMRYLGED